MEIRQIRYAEAVARYSSFSRAAEAMFVTQQTLSQQIKRLEEEIGFAVFERNTRSVSLTTRGKTFIDRAEPLLNAFDAFSLEVESLREDTGQSIRLGILPTFSHLNILETIYAFQAKEQKISVQVQIQKSSRLVDMVRHGGLDVAIGNLSQQQIEAMKDKYCIHVFSKDHICAVLHQRHPLAKNTAITLSDLEGHTLLLLERGSSIRSRMESALKERQISPDQVIDCPDIHSLTGMLASGVGIGFLSSQVAAQSITASMLSLPLLPEMETITALFYHRQSEKRQAMDALSGFFSLSDS